MNFETEEVAITYVDENGDEQTETMGLEEFMAEMEDEDEIDPAVGFILNTVKGDPIHSGQKWIEFHHNQPMTDAQCSSLSNALTVASMKTQPIERLIKVIQ